MVEVFYTFAYLQFQKLLLYQELFTGFLAQ